MNIARSMLTAVAFVGAVGSANAATSIVQNGSFETGTDPQGFMQVNAGETNIANWTVGGNSVDYIGFYWDASEGARSVDLAGSGPGIISQLLQTTIGQLYSVTFDISKNPDNGQVPRRGTSTVTDVGNVTPVVLATQALTFSAPNAVRDMMWQTISYSFVAISQQTLLSFAGDGPSSEAPPGGGPQAFGLTLDNVRVEAVDSVVAAPEPATWALMILGFGMVGSALRRRRAKVRFNFA